jgi:hypothetical protein
MASPMPRRRFLAVVLAGSALGACVVAQDLGSAGAGIEEDGGADSGSESSSPLDASGDVATTVDARSDAKLPIDGPNGPGPLGALPSGYCCTGDDECRFRKCVDLGGGKMCLDKCSASRPAVCRRATVDFACSTLGAEEYCQPAGSFACLDPATFVRGTKTTGGCCTDTGDGNTGSECEANLCLQIGMNPWFCTRRCDGDPDCPSDHRCTPVGDRKECVPRVTTLPCK